MADSSDDRRPSEHRILVVEDSPLASALIVQVLHALGFDDVHCAADGKQAWGYFEDGILFDLVICDWMMPKMTGLDVLKQLRVSHAEIPFIMITAKKDGDADAMAKAFGATAFVAKPFTAPELSDAITRSLPRAEDGSRGVDGRGEADSWDI